MEYIYIDLYEHNSHANHKRLKLINDNGGNQPVVTMMLPRIELCFIFGNSITSNST